MAASILNAVIESFFASLTIELLDWPIWSVQAAAKRAIFAYLEVWYNRHRLHSTLSYRSPTAFETQFTTLANHEVAA